jgi:hypothetical protein
MASDFATRDIELPFANAILSFDNPSSFKSNPLWFCSWVEDDPANKLETREVRDMALPQLCKTSDLRDQVTGRYGVELERRGGGAGDSVDGMYSPYNNF